VSVDAREVQGLSVRDVQKLFTGDSSSHVTIVGYSSKRGTYSVVLLRGGGGGGSTDMCAEACAAAARLHEDIDRLKQSAQEGQDDAVRLKADLEVARMQAEEAKKGCVTLLACLARSHLTATWTSCMIMV
jgi:hypothetical protein